MNPLLKSILPPPPKKKKILFYVHSNSPYPDSPVPGTPLYQAPQYCIIGVVRISWPNTVLHYRCGKDQLVPNTVLHYRCGKDQLVVKYTVYVRYRKLYLQLLLVWVKGIVNLQSSWIIFPAGLPPSSPQ